MFESSQMDKSKVGHLVQSLLISDRSIRNLGTQWLVWALQLQGGSVLIKCFLSQATLFLSISVLLPDYGVKL